MQGGATRVGQGAAAGRHVNLMWRHHAWRRSVEMRHHGRWRRQNGWLVLKNKNFRGYFWKYFKKS